MNNFDITIGLVFCFIVFVSGLAIAKKDGDSNSFFAGGGAVPWWISGLSLFMSFFSAGTFVVWGSIAYSHGMVAVTIQTGICVAGFIVGMSIAPRWNKTKTITVAEFLRQRLGGKLQKIYSIMFLLISLFTAGAFLYPVGKIIEVSTGYSLSDAILFLGVIIIIYTAVGGLWAVLITDVLQFVVLTAAVIIVVPLAFDKVGGVSSFINNAPDNFFALQNSTYTWGFLFALMLYNIVFIGGNWAYVQRYTSVATPKDAKKAGLIFGVLYLVSPIVWMLPPMIYRVLHPELGGMAGEGAYLQISKEVVPAGLLGLIIGSMIFATASSVNTTFNIASSVFTNDIYGYFRKKISNSETMIVARISTIVFGVLTISVALLVPKMGGIVEVVLSVGAITGSAMFLPPIWALYSRRQTSFSVLSTTIASLLLNSFFKFLSPLVFDFYLSRSEEMLFGVLCPAIILISFELIYLFKGKEDPKFSIYMKQKSLREDKTLAIENAEPDDASRKSRKIIGNAILAVGLIITFLGLIGDNGQVLVSSIGLLICIAAVWILRLSRPPTHLMNKPLLIQK